MKDILLTPQALISRWSINNRTLVNWRCEGRGPKYIKLGRRIRYRLEDVEAYEKQHLRQSTSSESNPFPAQ